MEWIFILLCLVPVVFCPKKLFNGFNLPQTVALSTLSAAGLTLGVAEGKFSNATPSVFIYMFLFYIFLSTLWTYPSHNGRKEFGLQASLLLVYILGCAFIERSTINAVAITTSAVLGFNLIYANAQTHLVDPFFPNQIKAGGAPDRPIGTIGNSNFFSSYLSSAIWLSIYAAFSFHKTILIIPAFAIFMVYKAGCRAGQLAVFGSLTFFVLVGSYYDVIPGGDFLFHALLATIITFFFFSFVLLVTNWDAFINKEIDPKGKQVWWATLRFRYCYILSALRMIKRKWLFGGGLWSYRVGVYAAQAEINDKDPNFLNPRRYLTPQPREVHNDWVEHVVEYGIFGFSLFLGFVVSTYYCGFNYLSRTVGTNDFFFMLILLSGFTSVLINAVFFFGLRMPSTGVMFWLNAACIVAISGKSVRVFDFGFFTVVFVAMCLGVFLWYCVIRRTFASHYFSKYMTSKDPVKKHDALLKTLQYAPYDTIYRTHAALAIQQFDPIVSNLHATKMLEHFDGMTPLNIMLLNVALSRAKGAKSIIDEAVAYLKTSHWLLPTFKPTNDLLSKKGIGGKSKYLGGQCDMKISDETVIWKARAFMEARGKAQLNVQLLDEQIRNLSLQRENFVLQVQLANSNLEATLIHEKKRLNLPDDWVFDPVHGEFLNPQEMSEEDRKRLVPLQGGANG